MKFGEMIDILQKKEKGYIVLINSGRFYIARGKDAILLNKELDLKLVCMEKQVCKVGFPNISLEKYIKILKRKRYAFIVYNFDRESNNLEIITKYDGRIKNLEKEVRRDCIMCKMGNGGYTEKEQKYMEAILKLYRSENNEGK